MTTARIVTADDLIGHEITTPDGRELGEIEDVIIDMADGKVVYVVMSRGGVMGLGEKYFAVPWNRLRVEADRSILLDVEPEVFDEALGFDPDHWPRFDDEAWRRELDDRYREAETSEESDSAPGDRDDEDDEDDGRFSAPPAG